MKRIFYSLLIAAVILPGATAHLQARDRKPKTSKTVQAAEPVRNVILMIGDGMGLAQVTSYMLRGGAPLSLARAQSIGLQSTFSASSEVTDSAAAATALATGTKTNNGMISMTPDKQPLRSVLERAAAAGLATGLVDTHAITDATPVAFIGHNESRKNEDDLAADFLRTDIDLFIGGGRDHLKSVPTAATFRTSYAKRATRSPTRSTLSPHSTKAPSGSCSQTNRCRSSHKDAAICCPGQPTRRYGCYLPTATKGSSS